jgi:dienelactone hydrolase
MSIRIRRREAVGLLAGAPGAAAQAPPAPAGSDSGSLYPLIEALAARRGFTASFPGPRWRSVKEWSAHGRQLVFDALGPAPPPVAPRAEVVERADAGPFIREKLLFWTTPEFRVPAYVHLPKGRPGRWPAIVDLHSHGGMFIFGKEKVADLGENHPVMTEYHKANYGGRPTATALARRGYVVITIDAFPFGERRLMMDEDLPAGWDRAQYSVEDVRRLNQKCRQKESTIVKSLAYAGHTWPGIVVWDDIRTLDYLVTRPEVDPARIGSIGVSMGGYRSLLLAGLDDRIAAGCVTGFMSTVRPMIRRHMDTHSFVHFIPGVHGALDLPEIAALRAPRPLLVQQCRRDGLFPPEGMEESVKKIEAVYRQAGAADAFTARFYDLPHVLNVEMQEEAFAWFDRWLK